MCWWGVGDILDGESREKLTRFLPRLKPWTSSLNLCDWFDAQTVLIDGGHGQFGADYALSAEDAAYYLRYLEGQDIGFEGINDLTRSHLGDARALLITAPTTASAPTTAFSEDDLDIVRSFVADGGAVVLFGSGDAPAVAREHLNTIAAALGSDLRLNADRVRDREHNVANNSTLPVTDNFVRRFRLFDTYGSNVALTHR